MNTDGLNIGSSIRGKPDLVSPRAAPKKDANPESRPTGHEPAAFSQVLKAKSAAAPSSPPAAPPAPRDRVTTAGRSDQVRDSRRMDDQDDVPSVKEKDFDNLEKPKTAKHAGSEREKAMQEFMDSMESELGIPPQRIVEAMAQLPKKAMLQTPEETASQVIDKLDLPPEQADQAYAKYMGLLVHLSQMPAATPAQAASPAMVMQTQPQGAERAAQMVSAKEKREALNQSLDRMSKQFFLQTPKPSAAAQAQRMHGPGGAQAAPGAGMAEGLNAEELQQMGLEPVARGEHMHLSPELMAKLEQQSAALRANPNAALPPGMVQAQQGLYQRPINAKGQADAQDADDDGQDALPPQLAAKLTALGAASAALGQSVQKTPQGHQVVQLQNAQVGLSAMGPGLSNSSLVRGRSLDSGDGDTSDFGDDGSRGGDLASGANGLKPNAALNPTDKPLGFHEALQGSAAAGGPNAMSNQQQHADRAANMQKIMDQAQMVVRKGGGEAVVRLNPDGLGEVHMKVMVKDGHVNLEMTAASKEAKKAIEDSLSELKNSLGQHKLSMGNVKVDVGLKNSNDNLSQGNQQRNMDMMNQNREHARQFFQEFHEGNMNQRAPFYEMPGIKAYQGPKTGPAPLQSVSASSVERARAEGRGERMNLVA